MTDPATLGIQDVVSGFLTAVGDKTASTRTTITRTPSRGASASAAARAAAAESTSSTEETTVSLGVEAKLSKPAMLPEAMRIIFAKWAIGLIALTCVALAVVALVRPSVSAWAFVGLALLGLFLVIAFIVLVMGFGNVEMSAKA